MASKELKEMLEKVEQLCDSLVPLDQVDYYKAMERLLYNYRRMQKLVAAEDDYMQVSIVGKSASIVVAPSGKPLRKDTEDKLDEMQEQKARQYERTQSEFSKLARVVESFAGDKEFAVVRMYYFGEDPRDNTGGHKYTFAEIADALGVDEKSARRWRTNIVTSMSVCLFKVKAAVQVGRRRLTNARIAPESRP